MRGRRQAKSIVAMIALVAMLFENTYSVTASVIGEQQVLSDEVLTTSDTQEEDAVITVNDNDSEVITEGDAGGGTDVIYEDISNASDDTVIEDRSGDLIDPAVSQVSVRSDGFTVEGMDEIALYVNTDRMNSRDSFAINIEGTASAVYDGVLDGTLYKSSSGVYRISGMNGDRLTIKAAGLFEGMTAEYKQRSDGNIQITLISVDAPAIEKKLAVSDSGYGIKGSGYDDITLTLDSFALKDNTRFNIYVDTKADVRYNGDRVSDRVITAISKTTSEIRLSNLNNEAFTIYIKGQNTAKVKAEYSIESKENGAVGVVLSLSDEDVDVEGVESEDTEEEEEATKREYSYSDADVSVVATLQYPEAIPDDADFVVTKVTSDTQGYNYDAYMQALNNNAGRITGDDEASFDDSDVLLYDIAFYVTDEYGNRVELQPEEGTVRISIRFKKDQLKEELAAQEDADVKVIHLPLTDGAKEGADTTADATDISASDIKVEVVSDSTSVSNESTDFTLSDFSVIGLMADGKMKPGSTETFKSVLGNASMYGIVANEMTLGGHLESNFATGKLNGNADVQACKNDGGNPGVTYIGEYTGSNFKMNKNGNQSTVLIYTTEDAKNKFGFNMLSESGNSANGINIDTASYTADDIKGLVSGMVSQASSKSSQLADENAYSFSSAAKIGNATSVIDLKKNGSGKGTYYINFGEGEYANARMLELILDEGQNIVFNIPDSEVNFQQYRITIGNKTWTTSGNSDEDQICQTVIFNCPNATKARTVSPVAGTFVVPNADFATQSVSAGWVIADTISNIGGAEWHCVWHDMPPATGSNVVIEAQKTVDYKTPNSDQKFWFDLYTYDSKTGKATLIQSKQNNGSSIVFDKLYFGEEGIYEYKLSEREAEDSFVHDPYDYYITYEVRLDQRANQYVVVNKTVTKKNRMHDGEDAVTTKCSNASISFNNQTKAKIPFDFSITKLFYQNDGTDWDAKRLLDNFNGYGADWPDGAIFNFDIVSFDGGSTNSGIRLDPPMPQKRRVTLTKDKRTDTFGRVYFEADFNERNYGNWEKYYDNGLRSWVYSKTYMYKVTEEIPDEADRVPGVQYTDRPVYIKLFVESYWDNSDNSAKVRINGRASYVNDNSIKGQECFPIGDADLEFVNAYYPGSLKIKKVVTDNSGAVVDNSEDFNVVVYRKTASGSKVYYGTDGTAYPNVHTETVKGNSEISFDPLPVGFTYYVFETDEYGTEITGDGTEYIVTYNGLEAGNSVSLKAKCRNKEVVITNKRQNGKIKLIKYDGENRDKLAGAEFALFKDGERYPDDNTVYTTDDEGSILVEDLPWGTYYFVETKAPNGYTLPEGDAAKTESKTIDASTVNELIVIEMNDDKIKGDLILYKVDDKDNRLAGATFTLYSSDELKDTKAAVRTSGSNGNYKYDEKGEVQTLTVNSEGVLNVTGLPFGTYRITEEAAPEGYNKADGDQAFEIGKNKAVVELWFVNTPIKANVEFIKVDADDKPLKGVTFVLSRKIDGEYKEITSSVSGFDGHVRVEGLGKGEYYFKETVPEGYEAEQTDFYFEITEADDGKTITLPNIRKKIDGFAAVVNTPLKGRVELFKYELRSGKKLGLDGAEFELYSYKGDSKQQIGKTYTTNDKGIIEVGGLDWGTYYFTETKAPEGFNPVTDPVYFEITREDSAANKAARVEVENTPIKGYVSLEKVDKEDNKKKLSDVTFDLYAGTPDAPGSLIGTYMTANGEISESTVGALEYGSYFFRERETIKGYILSEEPYPFTISEQDQHIKISAVNERLKGRVTLEKYNSNRSEKLDGAEFDLYKSPENWVQSLGALLNFNKVGSYVTANGGVITVEGLEWGTYYFEETKAPKGFIKSDEKYVFTIDDSHLDESLTYDRGVPNTEDTGAIKLIKDDGEGNKLAGAKFELYKDGVRYPDETKDYTTDDKGEIFVENLEWGTYYFIETEVPEGFEMPEGDAAKTESVVIDRNSTVQDVKFHVIEVSNKKIYGELDVIKVDGNDNELEGAEFSLVQVVEGVEKNVVLDGDNGSYTYNKTSSLGASLTRQNLVTNGARLSVTGLPCGKYRVYEEKAPKTFNKAEGYYEFSINEQGQHIEYRFVNLPVSAGVEFIKENVDGQKLEGAVFKLYKYTDPEKKTTADLGTATSDSDGIVKRMNLGTGSYYFKEIKAAKGHVLSNKLYTFEITDNDQGKTVTLDNADRSEADGKGIVINEEGKGKVRLFKAVEGTNDGLEGAVFDLYKNGDSAPVIKDLKSDADGYVRAGGLDWGVYYFRETKAPEGFALDDKTRYSFEINADNVFEEVAVDLKGNELRADNTPIIGQADLKKVNSVTDKPLAGAVFALYHADGKVVAGYEKMITDAKGMITTRQDLKAGSYYFKELEAPTGFIKSEEKYDFTIDQSNMGTLVHAGEYGVAVNTPISGKVELYKYAKDDDDKTIDLSGAEFELYTRKTVLGLNVDSKYREEAYTTDGKGIISVSGLPWATYVFKETKAPAGYENDNAEIEFVIDENRLDYTGEYRLSHENKPVKGKVKLIKYYAVDGQRKGTLEGASFRFYKLNGSESTEIKNADNDGLYFTDKNGEIMIGDLDWGTYYFEEISTLEGFAMPEETKSGLLVINAENVEDSIKTPLTAEITNEKIYGNAELLKVEDDGNVLAGAVFELYTADGKKLGVKGSDGIYTYDEEGKVTSLTTPANGRIAVKQLPYGSYYFKEIAPPPGYNLNPAHINFSIVSNQPAKAEAQVTKTCINSKVQAHVSFIKADTSADKPLEGVVFRLYKDGAGENGADLEISDVTSDANGVVGYTNLGVGKYHFEEISTPYDAYMTSDDELDFEITAADNGKTVKLLHVKDNTVINTPKSGKVELTKYYRVNGNRKGTLAGAIFELYKVDDKGNSSKLGEYTVPANGKLTVGDLKWGSYYFKEIYAPNGYYFDPDKEYTFRISGENIKKVQLIEVDNDQLTGSVEIEKLDSVDKKGMENVTFDLYKDYGTKEQSTIAGLITDKSGKAGKDGLLWGNYTIIETKTSEGHVINTIAHNFVINGDNLTKSFTGVDAILNDRIQGYVELLKKDGETKKPMESVQFDLYKGTKVKSEHVGTYITNANGKLTDEKGSEKIGPLDYGTYYFEEVTPEGYEPLDMDLSFRIDTDGQTISFVDDRTVYNTPFEGGVILRKTDENGKPLANAEFTLYAETPRTMGQTFAKGFKDAYEFDKYYTNSNGELRVTGLKWDNYFFVETKAPDGYEIIEPGKRYTFTIDGDTVSQTISIGTIKNKKLPGSLELEKLDREKGTPLAGAEFKLIRIDADGETDVSSQYGAQGGVFVTGADGKITVNNVDWGTYFFRETKAPDGYEAISETNKVESSRLTVSAGNWNATAKIMQPQKTRVYNDKGYGYVSLKKVFFGKQPESLAGVEFALINDSKQVKLGTYKTDEDGIITADVIGRLEYGDYHFEEVSIPAGSSYVVSSLKLRFTIDESNSIEEPIQFTFVNSQVRASVKFIKIDPFSNDRISDIRFDLFNAENDEFVTSAVSDAQGIVKVTGLPMGSYYFLENAESAAAAGYVATTDRYNFEVTEDYMVPEGEEEKFVPIYKNGETIEATEVPNLKAKGSICLQKFGKTIDGSIERLDISDAAFELYKNGELFMDSEKLAGLIEGKELVVKDLEWGSYYFKETKAPKGYALPEGEAAKSNKVVLDASTVSASLTTPLICQISDESIRVFISKRTVGGSEELAGARMSLYAADDKGAKTGEALISWTSGTTSRLIEIGEEIKDGIQAGKSYVIHEDMSPVGYGLSEDIVFSVNANGSVKASANAAVEGSGNGMTVIMKDAPLNISISKKEMGTDTELSGAALRIMDGDKAIETWNSTGKPHTVKAALTAGKSYTLEETDPPKGYYTAEPITFTVKGDGTISIVKDASASATVSTVPTASGKAATLTMFDRPIRVEISKKRLSGKAGDYVQGAELALYEKDGDEFKQIFSWVSPESGAVLIDYGLLKVGGSYKVVETKAPAGYIKASDLYFTVKDYSEFEKTDENGLVTQSVNVFDTMIKAVISKQAVTGGAELPGATLQIIDDSGKVVIEFKSGEKQTVIVPVEDEKKLSDDEKKAFSNYNILFGTRFEAGKSYILREITAPYGYALAEDVTFSIDDNGTTVPNPVVMHDKPLEIQLSKKDIATGGYLAGASLEFYNEANEKVAEWESGDKPVLLSTRNIDEEEAAKYAKVIAVKLAKGTYRLHEAKAPEGYAIAEDITFKIDDSCVKSDSGVIREESMYDYREGTTVIIGKKDWIAPKDNAGNVSPDYSYPDIRIELYRDSAVKGVMDKTPIKSVTLTNGSMNFAFGNLDLYKKTGGDNYEYTYKLVEVMSDEASGQYMSTELPMTKTANGNEAVIRGGFLNTLSQETTKLTGNKTFILFRDKNGKILNEVSYDDVTLYLLQNGRRVDIDGDGKVESVTIKDAAKATDGVVTFEFKDLPKYDLATGNEYKYTIEEADTGTYESSMVYRGTDCSIVNIPKDQPFAIAGTKAWLDPEGAARPDVTIGLYRDGKLFKETKLDANYNFSFDGLYEYNLGYSDDEGDNRATADGHKFVYTIKETGANGYNATIEGDGEEMSVRNGAAAVKITNRIKQEYVEITGNKFWDDRGDSSRRPDVTVNLYASDTAGRDNELVDTYVIPNTKSTYEFGTPGRKQLPKYDINGKVISYRVEEAELKGYVSKQTGNDFTNTPSRIRVSKLEATNREELPGAVLAIVRKSDGKEIERWISGNESHYIEALDLGEVYTLVEISAPEGYVKAAPIDFQVGLDGVEQKVEMFDDPILGSVILTKLDESTREKLAGAEFELYSQDGKLQHVTGNTGDYTFAKDGIGITTLAVNSDGELKIAEIPYGSYYFKETKAPAGYELKSGTVAFTISEQGMEADVSFTDARKLGSVTLTKVSEDGNKALSGAVFELYSKTPRSSGQAAASTVFTDAYYRYGTYTTDSSGRITVSDLPWDDYFFVETEAPEGYEIARDISGDSIAYTFTVGADNVGPSTISLGNITNPEKEKESGVAGVREPIAEKVSGVLGVRSAPKKGVLGARTGPATGDASTIALWLALLIACVGTIVWLISSRKKKDEVK